MSNSDHLVEYVTLRQRRPEFAKLRIAKNEEAIVELTEQLDLNGALLRSPLVLMDDKRAQLKNETTTLQHRISAAEVERRRLDKMVITEPLDEFVLMDEYERICSTPSVYDVAMYGTKLFVKVEARMDYEGDVYHLGDWKIVVDLSDDEFSVTLDQSGLTDFAYDSANGMTSFQYSWDWGFCFGANIGLVFELFEAGEYVAAIQTAASYMNEVNPDHLDRIEMLYRKV